MRNKTQGVRMLGLMVMTMFLSGGVYAAESKTTSVATEVQSDLPYYKEIMNIIGHLEYSGFEAMKKPDVSLNIDFVKRTWTLRNIHRYDKEGGILLEEGRYGLCAELSTYVYQKLRPILSNRYELKFAVATEPGFFPTHQSNHIVLLISDRMTNSFYFIDPSFHKYGKAKDFSAYQIFGVRDALSFVKDKSADVTFLTEQAMPLFMKDDLMLSFAVTSVDGIFDKDNFLIVLTANSRNTISGLNVVVVGKYRGQIESYEGKELLVQLFNPLELKNLKMKIGQWLAQSHLI
ncbi:MAG: hypothetical protein HQL15_06875 [Candidatus Omnitrophica bacterium]|nr:hypothetical protein [Candidatus Omnitrophota bacterium]